VVLLFKLRPLWFIFMMRRMPEMRVRESIAVMMASVARMDVRERGPDRCGN
jgi:hypothetical protein